MITRKTFRELIRRRPPTHFVWRFSRSLTSKSILFHNENAWPSKWLNDVQHELRVVDNFVNETEEKALCEEVQKRLRQLRYEDSHWDDAIHNYRETERSKWSEQCTPIIDRIRTTAFSTNSDHIMHVHVLDLHKDGHIKPHIDSVRYCGDVIAGVSLLSDSIMRFTHETEKQCIVDALLTRRSLYIIRGLVRYHFQHELLANDVSYFAGAHVERDRRISIICRDQPKVENIEKFDHVKSREMDKNK